jgi:two-component system, NtrC family, sensor histidine kinase HydH
LPQRATKRRDKNVVTIASEQAASISAVASIVHDLRNPLATIHGSAELLAASRFSQAQVHRIARNMYCASVRMRELLEEFLDRSRSAENEREPCDLRELVASAVEKIAVSAEFQSVHIAQAVPEGLIVALDRRLMRRVLVNLLVNALEVMPNGGTINISAVSGQRSVLIRVRDTGPGIPPEIRGRLFQPFASRGKAGGIGLGLAFSRQVVVNHRGEIWAESTRRGACLALRLPRTNLPRPGAQSPTPV